MVERVIARGFDGFEYGQPAAGEHLQVHAEASIDHFCQWMALGKEDAGARDQILHQADVALVEAAFDEVALDESMRGGHIKRNVNASDVQVPGDILPEVRQLQRRTGSIRKTLALFITIAAEI